MAPARNLRRSVSSDLGDAGQGETVGRKVDRGEKARAPSRSFGLALAASLLAVLALLLSVPQHVLDWDEDGGPAVAAMVHGGAHTIIDHQAPGHACASHCAAHAMGDAPPLAAVRPTLPRPLAWLSLDQPSGLSLKTSPPDRPPRA